MTGADHLRWLMANIRQDVCSQPPFSDCRLILTMHDSLVYEVPHDLVARFITAIRPVMMRRPEWCDIDVKVKFEKGERFGDMEEFNP